MISKKYLGKKWTFSFQICFRIQFRTLGSGQTENMPITPIGVQTRAKPGAAFQTPLSLTH